MPRPKRPVIFRDAGLYDVDGKPLGYKQEVPPRKRRDQQKKSRERFALLYYDATVRLLGMTGAERDVLDALVRRMSHNEAFFFSGAEVAEELGMFPSNISRATKTLRDRGLLIDIGHRRFFLDPRVWWRGDADVQRKTIDELAELDLLHTIEGTTP